MPYEIYIASELGCLVSTSDMTVTGSLRQPTHSNAPGSAPPENQLQDSEVPHWTSQGR